jgi:riboflavin synthase
MFSGIIEDVGVLRAARPDQGGRALVIGTSLPLDPRRGEAFPRERVRLGDSIAVDGVCLTVERFEGPDAFAVLAGRETLERTTLGGRRVGARLHLERALRVSDRLDGHIVSGHVDGVGRVRSARSLGESFVLWVEPPDALARYIAEKGSVCLDGVSLTVNELDGAAFRVNLIPYTAAHTHLGALQTGDPLNIEVDLLARYLERLVGRPAEPGGLTRDRLVALGFAPGRGGPED